jgi:WD40 repeat protein
MRKFTALLGLSLLLAGCERSGAGPTTAPPPPAPAGPYPGPPLTEVAGAAFSRDGRLLLTAYRVEHLDPKDVMPKRLALWEVVTAKKLWAAHPASASREDPPADTLVPIGFLPGDRLVLLRDKTSLQLWDVAKGSRARTFAKDGDWALSCAALSADGNYVLTGGGSTRYPPAPPAEEPRPLQLWEVASAKRIRTFGRPHLSVYKVALSPDGRLALSASHPTPEEAATLMLWDMTTGKRLPLPAPLERGKGLGFTPDSKLVAAVYSEPIPPERAGKRKVVRWEHELALWEVRSAKKVLRFQGLPYAAAFTPDGKHLVGVNSDGLKVWEVASGREVRNLREGGIDQFGFALSPNGKLAFTGSGSYRVGTGRAIKLRLWDVPEGELARVLDDSPWATER